MLHYEEVNGSQTHIMALYRLLRNRKFSVSHDTLPEYKEHEKFVKNHPYRTWQIIYNSDEPAGSFYIAKDNAIGINLGVDDVSMSREIIVWIFENWSPLSAVKSVRPAHFFMRVPIGNDHLVQAIKESKGNLVEKVFIFP